MAGHGQQALPVVLQRFHTKSWVEVHRDLVMAVEPWGFLLRRTVQRMKNDLPLLCGAADGSSQEHGDGAGDGDGDGDGDVGVDCGSLFGRVMAMLGKQGARTLRHYYEVRKLLDTEFAVLCSTGTRMFPSSNPYPVMTQFLHPKRLNVRRTRIYLKIRSTLGTTTEVHGYS